LTIHSSRQLKIDEERNICNNKWENTVSRTDGIDDTVLQNWIFVTRN